MSGNVLSPSAEFPSSPDLPAVTLVDGRPMTTSLDVAAKFGKRHDHVLRLIQGLLSLDDLGPKIGGKIPPEEVQNFWRQNFIATTYDSPTGKGGTRKRPMYYLTRDAFAFLVMGFTGAAAALWKIRYINAFNAMEAELRRRAEQERKLALMPDDLAFAAGKLAVAFARLTPERVRLIRDVLYWRGHRYSYPAIARMLHASVGTVRYIVRRYYHEHVSLTLYALDRLDGRALL